MELKTKSFWLCDLYYDSEAAGVIEYFSTCMGDITTEASCDGDVTDALDDLSVEVQDGFEDTCGGNCFLPTMSNI